MLLLSSIASGATARRAPLPPPFVGIDRSIVPAASRTIWDPGVPGGIPSRSTIYTTINASTYGNGSSDATAGIQTALNNCPSNQVVLLSAGTFKIATGPLFIRSNRVLRGAGPDQTILSAPSGAGQCVVVIGNDQWSGSFGSSTNLTATATHGSYSVTVASASGFSAGQMVLIDKIGNSDPLTYYADSCTIANEGGCRGWFSRTNRPYSQVMQIESIVGNTVTFTTPFRGDYETAYTAQMTAIASTVITNAGVEDLKVQGGEGGDSGGNFMLNAANKSWVKNCEGYWSIGSSIHIYTSLQCTVRDSYFHETPDPNPGGAGYGIDISRGSADNLIENNISWNFNKVMVMRASGGGNVIAYNYFEDGYGAGYKSIMEVGMNCSHMTTGHHELFEGNQGFNIGADARWGNSVHITFHRNHAVSVRRSLDGLGLTDVGDRAAVNIKAQHHYYNFFGNVLGYSGMSPAPAGANFVYEENTSTGYGTGVPMWKLGQGDSIGTSGNNDSQVKATMTRDGNYDYYTASVAWDRTPQTIPNSLYLTSAPSFFGANEWPWVDPSGANDAARLKTLPARARFDALGL